MSRARDGPLPPGARMSKQKTTRPDDAPPALPQFLRVREAAAVIGVTPAYLYTVMDGGHLPYLRMGRLRRINVEDFRAFIERGRVGK
jgi:excisionase family DNA binding protein